MTKFMETGELPPPDTMCETDGKVFDQSPGVVKRGVAGRGFGHGV
jgi:hypothetical protein